MPAGDIYRVTLGYEGPTMASSTSIYYREEVTQTAPVGATRSLAESFIFSKLGPFINVLSVEWKLPSIHVTRVDGEPTPPILAVATPNTGTRTGNSLPADNCLLIQLLQQIHPRTSNGRMYLPGLSESDSNVGIVEAAFLANQVVTLTNAISASLAEIGGAGSWLPGVISVKVRDAPPGDKDWQGAFSLLIAALGNPVIARQVRRRTKVRGQST